MKMFFRDIDCESFEFKVKIFGHFNLNEVRGI